MPTCQQRNNVPLCRELWKSDGTEAGTVLVKDINPGLQGSSPGYGKSFHSVVFFQADDGAHGSEVWASDGTELGTVLIADINPTGSSSPQYAIESQTALYFTADDGINGNELWVIDKVLTGDLNGNFSLGLEDAILALRILSQSEFAETVYLEAEVDKDGKIGLPDALYILQSLAGLR